MHKVLHFCFFIFLLVSTFNINAESKFNASHSEIEIISHQSVPNEKNITVWDTNANDWRSFRYDRIIEVTELDV